MKNDPLLFVDSIQVLNNGEENQHLYDSRSVVKNMALHRIDDINAMLQYDLNIRIKIKTFDNKIYDGIPKRVYEHYIEILNDDKNYLINLNDICDIRIRKNDL